MGKLRGPIGQSSVFFKAQRQAHLEVAQVLLEWVPFLMLWEGPFVAVSQGSCRWWGLDG